MTVNKPVARVVSVEPRIKYEHLPRNLNSTSLFAVSPDQSVMSRAGLHRVFAGRVVEVSRNRPKLVLLLDPAQWVRGRDGS